MRLIYILAYVLLLAFSASSTSILWKDAADTELVVAANEDQDSSSTKTSDDEKKEDVKEKLFPDFINSYQPVHHQSHSLVEYIFHLPSPYYSLPEIPPELS